MPSRKSYMELFCFYIVYGSDKKIGEVNSHENQKYLFILYPDKSFHNDRCGSRRWKHT